MYGALAGFGLLSGGRVIMRMKTRYIVSITISLVLGIPAHTSVAADLELRIPVACEIGRTCWIQNYVDHNSSGKVGDYTCGTQTYKKHSGTDFRLKNMVQQQLGVQVLAAAAGHVTRMRDGMADMSVREQGLESLKGYDCGNGVVIEHPDGWETQYCHMARGSIRVKRGDVVKSGDALGLVGLSGNTEYAHV